MKAYKATNKDMICSQGKGNFQYQFGLNRADTAKTRKSGLHFTEDPFLTLDWYPLGCGNRYFLCEALGDISEEKSDNTMSCTELIFMEELSLKALAGHGMMYMIDHPLRSWVKTSRYLNVKKEQAAANCAGANRNCKRDSSEGKRAYRKLSGTHRGAKRDYYWSKAPGTPENPQKD